MCDSTKTTTNSGTTSGNTSGTFSGNTTAASATDPTNPDWVTGPLKDYASGVTGLIGADPSSFIPGASALQQQAFGQAGILAQPSPYAHDAQSLFHDAIGAIGTANNSTTPQVTGATIDPTSTYSGQTAFGDISNYFNPYENTAVRSALGDIDYQGQIADQRARSAATSAGAWAPQGAGSGEDVYRALTGDNFARAAASTAAGMRNQGFTTALTAAQQDAQRRQDATGANAGAQNARAANQAGLAQQASTTNAGLHNDVLNRYLTSAGLLGQMGSAYGAMGNADAASTRANIGLLGDLGAQQRDINGQVAQAPLTVKEQIAQILQGGQFGLFHGQNTNTSGTTSGTEAGTTSGTTTGTNVQSDPMGGFGGILSAGGSLLSGAAAFSDSALKRDISTADYDAKGRRWVTFNYFWDEPDAPKRRGVIAQEVRETDPEAVFVHPPSGYLMVDYAQLGV